MKNLDDVALAILTLQENIETDLEKKIVDDFVDDLLNQSNFKICPNCGKEFKPKHYNQKYCSAKCQKHSVYIQKKETRICLNCGKEFQINKYFTKQFCTAKCKREYNKKN